MLVVNKQECIFLKITYNSYVMWCVNYVIHSSDRLLKVKHLSYSYVSAFMIFM